MPAPTIILSKIANTSCTAGQCLVAAVQLAGMGELQGQSQRYNAQLQEYNGRLQNEVRGLKDAVAALQAAKDTATEATAALRGQLTAAEAQITTAKVRFVLYYRQQDRARAQDSSLGTTCAAPLLLVRVPRRRGTSASIGMLDSTARYVHCCSWQSSQNGCGIVSRRRTRRRWSRRGRPRRRTARACAATGWRRAPSGTPTPPPSRSCEPSSAGEEAASLGVALIAYFKCTWVATAYMIGARTCLRASKSFAVLRQVPRCDGQDGGGAGGGEGARRRAELQAPGAGT